MKTNCRIIEDLMPLYIDDVCSEESKHLVKEHLVDCHECRAKYNAQTTDFSIDRNMIDENLKAIQPFKKIKRSNLIILTIAGILAGTLCGSAFSYFIGANKLIMPALFGASAGTILSLIVLQLKMKK